MSPLADFVCLSGCCRLALEEPVYACPRCGGLLQVQHDPRVIAARDAVGWRKLFSERRNGGFGPDASGVWRFREWVLPDLPEKEIITLGEGSTPLVYPRGLAEEMDCRLFVKQCGQSLTGSFKDLGMTVLISQVNHMRHMGREIPAVACASTGDTSAALAAYGAAAGIRTLVLLPRGKISHAQLTQPLASGARVLAIATDFDGCMRHVQKLCEQEGVYLANSKNSLRIEGQKTVAFEIAEALEWKAPEWVAIPGGNLGNVSALYKGFCMLRDAGLIARLPRILCAQASRADPLYQAFLRGFDELRAQRARQTEASAIRIGDPVSYPKAAAALRATDGVVASVDEQALVEAASRADAHGLYTCPHTAVALAAVHAERQRGLIAPEDTVVTIATAHGLKFTEFKERSTQNQVPGVQLREARAPVEVEDDFNAVRKAALS